MVNVITRICAESQRLSPQDLLMCVTSLVRSGYNIPLLFCVLALLCLPLGASAQTEYLNAYLLSFPQTIERGITAPFRWETEDWLWAGGLLATGGALYLADQEIRDWVVRHPSAAGDAVAPVVRQLGEYKYVYPVLILSSGLGFATGSPRTIDAGMLSLKSAVLAGSAAQAIKLVSQRERPYRQQGKGFWNGRGISLERDSFVSGHSTLVWSIAPILADQFRETGWVPVVAYSLAGLTSLSRVYEDKHWSSDIWAGAIVGFLSSQLVLQSTPRFSVHPSVNLQGWSFYWQF